MRVAKRDVLLASLVNGNFLKKLPKLLFLVQMELLFTAIPWHFLGIA
jgi:hypothetical protein